MNADLAESLSFQQTVPRHLAHRRAMAEVFIADSAQADDTEFYLAVQLPRAHSLWFDRWFAYHDPLASAEAARQGAFVIVHRYLGVPVGVPFSLQRFAFQVRDLTAYRDDGQMPLEGILRFRLSTIPQRPAELGSLSFEGDLTIDRSLAMTMNGDIVFVSKRDYDALRAHQRSRKPLRAAPPAGPVHPLEPDQVGRIDRRNVVIGAPARDEPRFPLVVDQRHPSFFDHSYDHLPGPLIVEGFRQAAIVTACQAGAFPSPTVVCTGAVVRFFDFAEFEATPECSAEVESRHNVDGHVGVMVRLYQFGRRIVEGRIELSTGSTPERAEG